ncbi:sulfite exporter TauE/SafE family protein [Neorhodopirellula lusitana]|uniref:sulfite exporter TauE/SafE family protein n=1 Tax=Neorhodopirellula lusitana TaxID=445327 RepID=UPI00384DD0DE
MKFLLIVALGVLTLGYVVVLVMSVRRERLMAKGSPDNWLPTPLNTLIGFVTNFFDTLGIGNFAPTTAWFRYAKLVPDELIPGTMNVGHTLPVMLMAFLYIEIVEVESTTLLSMIGSSVIGAWVGAGIVSRLPKKRIQIGMGGALIVAALFMAAFQFDLKPTGAQAFGLQWMQLIPACLLIGMLGALMTIGVGLYAPCMILVSLMGMNPIAAFPIMMGSCAFLMPFASTRFILSGKYQLRASLGLTLGGIPAVLIAALLVKSLPLYALKWLVVVVVLVTAIQMLRSAFASEPKFSDPQ